MSNSVHSPRSVSVSDQAGVAVNMATVPTAAIWQPFKYISFTRTKDPAWHRASNDHHGKGKAECHS